MALAALGKLLVGRPVPVSQLSPGQSWKVVAACIPCVPVRISHYLKVPATSWKVVATLFFADPNELQKY